MDLTLASVIHDSFNKMAVKHNKSPYTYKTNLNNSLFLGVLLVA